MSHARTAAFRTAHTGARTTGHHRAPAIPRRLDPRRTARFMGIRCRPITADRFAVLTALIVMVGFLFDFDADPTVWTPNVVHVFRPFI